MRKASKIFILVLAVVFMVNTVSKAEDLNKMMNEFYAGLADIIERNMNSPALCVNEVEDYYAKNQAVVSRIRQETKKAMEQAAPMMERIAPMMEKYKSMSEEELAALEKKAEKQRNIAEQQMSSEVDRYSKALETFTMKYPGEGMKIAAKAMELLPL